MASLDKNMTLKKYFKKEWKMKWYELDSTIITTMLCTIFLLTIWPRFLKDAMSIQGYAYVILIIIFSLPIIRKGLKK